MPEASTWTREEINQALERAASVFERHQRPDGSWTGDYGGPLFLLPMYVAGTFIMNRVPTGRQRDEMVRYFRNHQNQDGGWGLHVEAHSHVFTSVLVYVAMRLLGVSASDEDLIRARKWFLRFSGARSAASWGKFTLALLGLYEYDGLDPVVPEAWILPKTLPIHPWRYWCHARMVALPMAYLYGIRAKAPETDLILQLRREIYDEPYEDIDWNAARHQVSPTDSFTPRSPALSAMFNVLKAYDKRPSKWLRRKALRHILDLIRHEDESTNYRCIGPVNKVLNMLVWHFVDSDGPQVARHLEVLPEYLYQAEDGLKMNGYNGTQLWDTAFTVQALFAAPEPERYRGMLQAAHRFIESNQVLENVRDHKRYYRHPSRGGWPFSTLEHGWPISDCTAEGLKAAILLEGMGDESISEQRMEWATELILSFQNEDGGWATYERTRGPKWLESLNPSDVFGDIMIDYSYPECSSSCIQALDAYRRRFPNRRSGEIERAIQRGAEYLISSQRTDGSWVGSWGICFTYGTWFGVWGLRAAGLDASHPAVQKACDFIESQQLPDGGWGEHAESCRLGRPVHTETGQAVMTSWALLALAAGGRTGSASARRGVRFLLDRQESDGTWPPEHIAGMFNKTSAIHYDNYLKIFPFWALALCGMETDATRMDN